MEQIILDYEKTRDAMLTRIEELHAQLRDEKLRTGEREALMQRIECLEEERYELLLAINDMAGRGRGT